ncbi:hypothetical protein D3C73_1528090 [compost metagenome]
MDCKPAMYTIILKPMEIQTEIIITELSAKDGSAIHLGGLSIPMDIRNWFTGPEDGWNSTCHTMATATILEIYGMKKATLKYAFR